MPTTRSSARQSGASSSPSSSQSAAGSKRKAEASPSASPVTKTKKRASPKKQKTIEETLPVGEHQEESQDAAQDTEMKDAEPTKTKDDEAQSTALSAEQGQASKDEQNEKSQANGDHEVGHKPEQKTESETPARKDPTTTISQPGAKESDSAKPMIDEQQSGRTKQINKEFIGEPTSAQVKDGNSEQTELASSESATKSDESKLAQGDAIEESSQREKTTPSSILEKGIIYFFFRGRVGIDDPSQVDDIARSYIVLRPLPRGAKLTDGSLGDANNLRLLALPKKVLPKSPKDRFMVFVEKSKANLADLKQEFLSASDYETKTAGNRHTPAATPIGEGVYALTSTGRETHLAYVLTIPKELSEVQKDIGLEAKGSWVTSIKNPKHASPAQAQLPKDPNFPQEILDEFRSLRWGQLQPKHLDYENCQLLVIGHKDHSFAEATETQDQEADPKEELEKLGEEDERRVEHLDGDDTVFEDLGIDAKEYPSVQTTW